VTQTNSNLLTNTCLERERPSLQYQFVLDIFSTLFHFYETKRLSLTWNLRVWIIKCQLVNFFILIGLLSSCKTHLSPKNNPDWQKVVCCLKIPLLLNFTKNITKLGQGHSSNCCSFKTIFSFTFCSFKKITVHIFLQIRILSKNVCKIWITI